MEELGFGSLFWQVFHQFLGDLHCGLIVEVLLQFFQGRFGKQGCNTKEDASESEVRRGASLLGLSLDLGNFRSFVLNLVLHVEHLGIKDFDVVRVCFVLGSHVLHHVLLECDVFFSDFLLSVWVPLEVLESMFEYSCVVLQGLGEFVSFYKLSCFCHEFLNDSFFGH